MKKSSPPKIFKVSGLSDSGFTLESVTGSVLRGAASPMRSDWKTDEWVSAMMVEGEWVIIGTAPDAPE